MAKTKPRLRFVFWRMFFGLSLIVYVTILVLHSSGRLDQLSDGMRLLVPVAVAPFGLCLLLTLLDFSVFRIRYGMLGRFSCTQPPDEDPLMSAIRGPLSGGVGCLTPAAIPFVTWRVYLSGLAFSIPITGQGFIPIEEFRILRGPLFGFAVLWHASSEIRNPVIVPSGRVYDTLLEAMAHHETQQQHPTQENVLSSSK